MIRISFLAFFVLAIAGMFFSLLNSAADEPKAHAKSDGPFAGKVVFFRDGVFIERVQIKELGKTPFLVGKLCANSDPSDGKTIWIAVSRIDSLLEFDSIEQARKTLDEIKKKQEAQPPPPGKT